MRNLYTINNIYKLCYRNNMHISKLESFLGVSTGYFSRLQRLGKQPRLEIVVQLCDWYGCSLDFLCYVDLLHKSKEEIDALLREDREKNYEG